MATDMDSLIKEITNLSESLVAEMKSDCYKDCDNAKRLWSLEFSLLGHQAAVERWTHLVRHKIWDCRSC